MNGVSLTQPLLRFRVASYVCHVACWVWLPGSHVTGLCHDYRYVKQMDELPGRITVAETVEDGTWKCWHNTQQRLDITTVLWQRSC